MTQNSVDNESTLTTRFRFSRAVVLWLVALGLAISFVPLYLFSITIKDDVTRLDADLRPLQTAVASTPAPLSQEQALSERLTELQTQTDQIDSLLPTLAQRDTNWSDVMAAINNYSDAELTLTALSQSDKQLTLRGHAVDDSAVVAYARRLEASGQFSGVVVQSIVLLSTPFSSSTPAPATETPIPSPTAVATGTATSGSGSGSATATSVSATATPTAVLHDEYENDDLQAMPIFLGQGQTHNFYPDFDVDNVTFLAKAGRSYEILTTALAAGVDTFLTVSFGDTTLTNDDAEPGTLSSRVQLQAPADRDVPVNVQITNRGPYGPEKQYQVLVQEVIPTATPTSPPTATPTATLTPTATHTPKPTLSPPPPPSLTPDLRDPFEPDDTAPSIIAIGEVQTHNFYPHGDVDKIDFLVKNGRHYQVVTADLALGVDTAMTVTLGDAEWENDDYDTPGSGNFAAAICFQADMDGTVVATLTNVSSQFAPDKTYTVSVQEVPFLRTDKDALTFGPVPAEGVNPAPQSLLIEGTEPLAWTAVTDTPWLTLDDTTGTTPTTINISVDISGLSAGAYEGNVTLGWSDFCRQSIPITLQVTEPATSHNDTSPALPAVSDVAQHPRDGVLAKPAPQQDGGAVEFVIVVELTSE